MKSSTINITNKNGENIHAMLDEPINNAVGHYCIFAHCFTCTSQLKIVKTISRELTNYGFGVLRFDFTGLGSSEGEFADTNFSHNIDDLKCVNEYLRDHYQAPSILIGHSLGGAAALVGAKLFTNIKAVATIGAPADVSHVSHLIEDAMPQIEEKGYGDITVGGRPFRIGKKFIDDLDTYDLAEIIPTIRKPILILHSPQDKIVSIENAAKIYKYAFHPKSFLSMDGADHLLSRKADSLYAARSIATWVERYIHIEEDKPMDPEEDQVVAHLDLVDGFTTQISNGRHTIIADEPKSVGGEDLGFGPYELLTAALGACTNMTLKMYAERKNWNLQEVYTNLSHNKEYIEDSKNPDSKGSKMDVITKKIEIIGDLTSEQRKKLIEISKKCPIHKTLSSDITITTMNK